jgi:hypothetical protein
MGKLRSVSHFDFRLVISVHLVTKCPIFGTLAQLKYSTVAPRLTREAGFGGFGKSGSIFQKALEAVIQIKTSRN